MHQTKVLEFDLGDDVKSRKTRMEQFRYVHAKKERTGEIGSA
jgi:hypothetical protein